MYRHGYRSWRGGRALLISAALFMPHRIQCAEPSWQEVAKALHLDSIEVATLASNKVLMGRETYRQVFDAYVGPNLPVFVTSDSLLNAFHVLYEESIVRVELRQTILLGGALEGIWKNLEAVERDCTVEPRTRLTAIHRARMTVGTALRLTGRAGFQPGDELGKEIEAEAQRVVEATAHTKPPWLGRPEEDFLALDYSRYRPRGFYTRNERLQGYFRALSWLHSIPFRLERDEELVAIWMIGEAAKRIDYGQPGYNFLRQLNEYANFFSQGDDWDIRTISSVGPAKLGAGELGDLRKELAGRAKGYSGKTEINDQIRFAPLSPLLVAEPHFRVISPSRLPDAVMFQRTTDSRRFAAREYPSGLEVCALLGSTVAQQRLNELAGPEVLKTVVESRGFLEGGTLYDRYLRCLAVLFQPPAADVPALFSQNPWQWKSAQTVLSSWAQMRHTCALHAKQSVVYGCAYLTKHAGFVEPVPDFYAKLADLSRDAERQLIQQHAFEANPVVLADEIRAIRKLVAEGKVPIELKKLTSLEELDADPFAALRDYEYELTAEWKRVQTAKSLLAAGAPPPIVFPRLKQLTGKEKEQLSEYQRSGMTFVDDELAATNQVKQTRQEFFDDLVRTLENGDWPTNKAVTHIVEGIQQELDRGQDYIHLWRTFGELCRRLESLAHKQLRPVPFNDEEARFLRDQYGATLGNLMFYGGNTYVRPRDDAPRIVDVACNPNTRRYLEVGIGRPRALYVLYPTAEGEVLCRGAVLPYYEFPHPQPLTDTEWKTVLDGTNCPPQPAWLRN